MDGLDATVMKSVNHMLKKSIENTEIDIMLGYIQEAGLCKEFEEFLEDDENKFTCAHECFVEFAKLYPDKFVIVPKDQQYSETIVVKID